MLCVTHIYYSILRALPSYRCRVPGLATALARRPGRHAIMFTTLRLHLAAPVRRAASRVALPAASPRSPRLPALPQPLRRRRRRRRHRRLHCRRSGCIQLRHWPRSTGQLRPRAGLRPRPLAQPAHAAPPPPAAPRPLPPARARSPPPPASTTHAARPDAGPGVAPVASGCRVQRGGDVERTGRGAGLPELQPAHGEHLHRVALVAQS